jgi:hypothetical protein
MNSLEFQENKEASYISKLRDLRFKMIDATCLLVEDVTTNVEENRRRRTQVVEIPPEVRLRQFANILGSWKYCHRPRCSRSRCCKGEPNHCLAAGLPLFSPDQIATLCAPRSGGKTIKQTTHGSVDVRLK